jgi:arylsulfatase A-like enzyme/Flp pilus assembly protein TadD
MLTTRAAAIAAAALVAACGRASPPIEPPRHLLLITIDTLRADRLACYGSTSVQTPNLDRLALEGAIALDATVHTPLTRPSHVSLFTGLLPGRHGIRDNLSPPLADSIPTLAEILRGAGFRTGGFVASVVLSAQSGLARGFDTYSDRFDLDGDDARFLNTVQKPGDRVIDEAWAWISAASGSGLQASGSGSHGAVTDEPGHRRGRFAAWVHLYEPHDPYDPPEPFRSRYASRPYDGEVAWSDELVGRLVTRLEKAGLLDQTLVLATSDHGEGLGEHGEPTHGFFVYETTLEVPLILRGPGIGAGRRVATTVRTIDLFPTLLDLLAVPRPPTLQLAGRSVAPALTRGDEMDEVPAIAESLTPLVHYGWSDLRAVRRSSWKFILAPRPELYNLARDPREMTNVLASNAARAAALRSPLDAELKVEDRVVRDRPAAAGVPPDLLEKLGALGYVGGRDAGEARPSGADPKDKIGDYVAVSSLMREGLVLLRQREYTASAARLRAVEARGVVSFELEYYLGRALAGSGLHREAARRFARAARRLPSYTPAWAELARSRAAGGDLDGAMQALDEGRGHSPRSPELAELVAAVWKRRGDVTKAAGAYEAAIALAPSDALLRIRLAELHRDAGNLPAAVARAREAVAIEDAATYWNSLGMLLGASGDLPGAEKAFAAATGRDPTNPQFPYNLGLVYLKTGRRDRATAAFKDALARDPSFAPARRQIANQQ